MNPIHDILEKFSHGEASLEESNTALKEAGATLYLDPDRSRITEAELAVTTVGDRPEDASGFGLLDVGVGSKVKVRVCNGRLAESINEVLADGSTSMTAYVLIGGKRYEVKGDRLAEITEHKPPKAPKPHPQNAGYAPPHGFGGPGSHTAHP